MRLKLTSLIARSIKDAEGFIGGWRCSQGGCRSRWRTFLRLPQASLALLFSMLLLAYDVQPILATGQEEPKWCSCSAGTPEGRSREADPANRKCTDVVSVVCLQDQGSLSIIVHHPTGWRSSDVTSWCMPDWCMNLTEAWPTRDSESRYTSQGNLAPIGSKKGWESKGANHAILT